VELASLSAALVSIVRGFHARGWAEATSTNYSFRHPAPKDALFSISRSGVDKSRFEADDLMQLDANGQPIEGFQHIKPSAETALHTMLYRNRAIGAVLHTHSVDVTVFSLLNRHQDTLYFQGMELQKGIEGTTTHESVLSLPMFDNAQDIETLSQQVEARLAAEQQSVYGFILKGHGLYAWGKDLDTAKRHIETYEFLVTCSRQLHLHHNQQ
jgi:methylthioribulose-1-phosphate dehydratase